MEITAFALLFTLQTRPGEIQDPNIAEVMLVSILVHLMRNTPDIATFSNQKVCWFFNSKLNPFCFGNVSVQGSQ